MGRHGVKLNILFTSLVNERMKNFAHGIQFVLLLFTVEDFVIESDEMQTLYQS